MNFPFETEHRRQPELDTNKGSSAAKFRVRVKLQVQRFVSFRFEIYAASLHVLEKRYFCLDFKKSLLCRINAYLLFATKFL